MYSMYQPGWHCTKQGSLVHALLLMDACGLLTMFVSYRGCVMKGEGTITKFSSGRHNQLWCLCCQPLRFQCIVASSHIHHRPPLTRNCHWIQVYMR